MIVLIDADSLPWVISHFCVKENLTELDDFKRKLDSYVLNIMSSVNSGDYIMYLSGSNNFRKSIQANKVYKGNRGKGEKPMYFEELRQYLIDTYKAKVCDGCEADDLLSLTQCLCTEITNDAIPNFQSCIASLDKDMQQVPGYHLNIKTMVVTEVSEEQANRTFWRQLLVGDSTDNVVGEFYAQTY